MKNPIKAGKQLAHWSGGKVAGAYNSKAGWVLPGGAIYKTGKPIYNAFTTSKEEQAAIDAEKATQEEQNRKTAEKAAQEAANLEADREMIRQFYQHYNAPLDMNDPYLKAITANASNAAGRQASNQGISGGLSVLNAQGATAAAGMGYHQQRQQMAMQGLGMLKDHDMNVAQLMEQSRQSAYDRQMQQMQMQAQNRAGRATAFGTIAGGVAGALPALAGPAGMAMLPTTIPAGMNLGGGLANIASGGGSFNPPAYQGLGTYRGGGSGGWNNYHGG